MCLEMDIIDGHGSAREPAILKIFAEQLVARETAAVQVDVQIFANLMG
jgi:hypothetical protein